jgi:hypothetical protein
MTRKTVNRFEHKGYITPPIPPVDDFVYFCIPCPNEPQNIENFLGAIQTLTKWNNYKRTDDKRGKIIADIWRDIFLELKYSIDPCYHEQDECNFLPPYSDRISWFPENPFTQNETIPDGYRYHPYTVVSNDIISTVVSQWGLGYKVGDVYTDLSKFPLETWLPDFISNIGNLPSFTVNDLVGRGVVKLHLLNIPQGGRAFVQVDGVVDLLNLELVELAKDFSLVPTSIPPETQVPIVIEVPIETDGTHNVKVTFVPNVDDSFIPIFFGGGLRAVEICGFGETNVNTDPCCPENNEINYQTYRLQQITYQQTLQMLDDGDTAASFNAPEKFDSDPSDTGDAVTARANALCRLVKRWIATALYNAAAANAYVASVASAIAQNLPFPAPISGMISDAVQDFTTSTLQGLVDDCQAQMDVACCMISALQGQDTTLENLSTSLDGCGFTFGSNQAQIAGMVSNYNKSENAGRAFIAIMNEEFKAAKSGIGATGSDCDCGCCDKAALIPYGGYGTTITHLGGCNYRIVQMGITDPAHGGMSRAGIQDQYGRPIKADYPDAPYTVQSVAGSTVHGICGDPDYLGDNFGGGFVPSQRMSNVEWWVGSGLGVDTVMKITLEEC